MVLMATISHKHRSNCTEWRTLICRSISIAYGVSGRDRMWTSLRRHGLKAEVIVALLSATGDQAYTLDGHMLVVVLTIGLPMRYKLACSPSLCRVAIARCTVLIGHECSPIGHMDRPLNTYCVIPGFGLSLRQQLF